MGEAAKISLKAIGMQDTHLLSKNIEEDSIFNHTLKQHSNFIKKHNNKIIYNSQTTGWPFGRTIKVEYNPQNMGDLLSNIWIKIKVPKIPGNTGQTHAPWIGRHFIKNITMFVDETKIEELTGDWMAMNDFLFTDPSEFVTSFDLLNYGIMNYWQNSLGFVSGSPGATQTAFLNRYDHDVLIQLPFFFCGYHGTREYKQNQSNHTYFPVCAVHKQKIFFEITFYKQSFWSEVTSEQFELDTFNIITEEIYISQEERNYIISNEYNLTAQTINKHPDAVSEPNIGPQTNRNKTVSINLTPNIPVSSIHWAIRNTAWENEDDPIGRPIYLTPQTRHKLNFFNRFNFTALEHGEAGFARFTPSNRYAAGLFTVDLQNGRDIMKSAKFFINDAQLPKINNNSSIYFSYYTHMQHFMPVSSTLQPVYTYSFSLYPKNSQPSGYLDFSQLKSDKTKLEIILDMSDENISNDEEDPPNLYSNSLFNEPYWTSQSPSDVNPNWFTGACRVLIYYKGYEQFRFVNGFISKSY